MAVLNERGHEVLDDRPVAMPIGYKRPMTLEEQIRRFVRNELSNAASADGHESFEEADDFEVDDEYDPASPWELNFDQEGRQRNIGEELGPRDDASQNGTGTGGVSSSGSGVSNVGDDGKHNSSAGEVSAKSEGANSGSANPERNAK